MGSAGTPVPPEAVQAAQESVGAAYAVAEQAPAPFGDAIRSLAASSFMDGFAVGTRVAAGVVLVGAVLAALLPPGPGPAHRRGRDHDDSDDTAAPRPRRNPRSWYRSRGPGNGICTRFGRFGSPVGVRRIRCSRQGDR